MNKLSGKKVLVTAGPTYEPIDAVRYIGNYSTGRMGFAIADAFVKRGAEVYLVSGPVNILPYGPVKKYVAVETAAEMFAECVNVFGICDIAVLSAAVADYCPEARAPGKIKSTLPEMNLVLRKTVDIAAELGKMKKPGQLLAGFALETENAIRNATQKLKKKNFDFIVLNSLEDEYAGFGYDTNKITIIGKDNKTLAFGLDKKDKLAVDIVDYIENKLP